MHASLHHIATCRIAAALRGYSGARQFTRDLFLDELGDTKIRNAKPGDKEYTLADGYSPRGVDSRDSVVRRNMMQGCLLAALGILDRLILRDDRWERISQHIIGDERARAGRLAATIACL